MYEICLHLETITLFKMTKLNAFVKGDRIYYNIK